MGFRCWFNELVKEGEKKNVYSANHQVLEEQEGQRDARLLVVKLLLLLWNHSLCYFPVSQGKDLVLPQRDQVRTCPTHQALGAPCETR